MLRRASYSVYGILAANLSEQPVSPILEQQRQRRRSEGPATTPASPAARGMVTSTKGATGLQRSELHELTRKFNCFYYGGYQREQCPRLYCQGYHIGFISEQVEPYLRDYPDLFTIEDPHKVVLGKGVNESEVLSAMVDRCLRDLRKRDEIEALRGWREEKYDVRRSSSTSEEPLFVMERSATSLFGVRKYGVDINGYVNHPEKGPCIWMSRRSKTKPTWPGCRDIFVAGGLASGLGVHQTTVKEAMEEANIDSDLSAQLVAAGTVAIFYQSSRGLFPNTEYVFDLELPVDYEPKNNDGEVDEFFLVPFDEVMDVLTASDMKVTSIPCILDFLVRKGVITQENEPDYLDVVGNLHLPIHDIFH